MFSISIIICCYNSEYRIGETIKHIAKQKLDKHLKVELIIIDNNSFDKTVNTAIDTWERIGTPEIALKIISEPKPGLSNARKKGVECAKYDYILFCDDDNWLFEYYIIEAFKAFSLDAEIAAVGGYGLPIYEDEPPAWLKEFSGYYATGMQSLTEGIIDVSLTKMYIYGAGAVFKKSILSQVLNDVHPLFLSDRVGDKLISGGDNEICYRILIKGHKIFSNSEMKFYHYLTRKRLTKFYFLKLNYSFGYSYFLLLPYLDYLNKINRPKYQKLPLWLHFYLLKNFTIKYWSFIFKEKNKIKDIHKLKGYYFDLGMLKSSFSNASLISKAFKYISSNG